MSNHTPTPHPESLNAVWRAVHELENALEKLNEVVKEQTWFEKLCTWLWKERAWTIPGILIVLGGIGTVLYYAEQAILEVAGYKIDGRMNKAIEPLNKQIQAIDGNTKRIEGILSVLQGQVIIQNNSSSPHSELWEHHDELKEVKGKLSVADRSTPQFWPTSFQIINLLSQSSSNFDVSNKPQMLIENNFGIVIEGRPPGTRFLLKGTNENVVINDGVITFDPNVRLKNVTFINCIFVLPVVQIPSKHLQEIGNALLRSDISHVTINVS